MFQIQNIDIRYVKILSKYCHAPCQSVSAPGQARAEESWAGGREVRPFVCHHQRQEVTRIRAAGAGHRQVCTYYTYNYT